MMSFESFCDIYWRDRQHWYAVASADSGFGIMCTKKQGLKYPYLILHKWDVCQLWVLGHYFSFQGLFKT